mgnify:CR=1 FL=1
MEHKIKKEKKRIHNEFFKINKKTFIFLDILVACIILFNFGAVVLTNLTVVRNVETTPNEETGFYEVNPVHAKLSGYDLHPQWKSLMLSFLKQSFLWFLMIASYVYYRRTIFTEQSLYIMIISVLFYFTVLGFDFFNNLGLIGGLL